MESFFFLLINIIVQLNSFKIDVNKNDTSNVFTISIAYKFIALTYGIPTVDFLQKSAGDNLTLVCISNDKNKFLKKQIKWILPHHSACQTYDNLKCDSRLTMSEEVEPDNFQITLHVHNLQPIDSGFYRCVPKESIDNLWEKLEARRWLTSDKHSLDFPLHSVYELEDILSTPNYYEERVYIYVRDYENSRLFVPLNDTKIMFNNDKISYINCLITDPTAKVELYVDGKLNSALDYDDRYGFTIKAEDFDGIKFARAECRAKLRSEFTTDTLTFDLIGKEQVDVVKNRLFTKISPKNLDLIQLRHSNLTLNCNANLRNVSCNWKFNGKYNNKHDWYNTKTDFPSKADISSDSFGSNLTITDLDILAAGVYRCKCSLQKGDSSSSVTIAVRDNRPSIEVVQGNFRRQVSLVPKVGQEDGPYEQLVVDENSIINLWARVNIFFPINLKMHVSFIWLHRYYDINYGDTKSFYQVVSGNEISLKSNSISNISQSLFDKRQYHIELPINKTFCNCSEEYILKIKVLDATVNYTYRLYVRAAPKNQRVVVTTEKSLSKKTDASNLELGKEYYVWCITEGYPTEYPTLSFQSCSDVKNCKVAYISDYADEESSRERTTLEYIVYKKVKAIESGKYFCAFHDKGKTIKVLPTNFFVSDVQNSQENDAFTFTSNTKVIFEGSDIILRCQTILHNYGEWIKWDYQPFKVSNLPPTKTEIVEGEKSWSKNNYSITYELKIKNIRRDQSGIYFCERDNSATKVERYIEINVLESIPSHFDASTTPKIICVKPKSPAEIFCNRNETYFAQVSPSPEIQWFKDGKPFTGTTYNNGALIKVDSVDETFGGDYECQFNYANQTISERFKVIIEHSYVAWIAMGIIVLLLITLIMCITYFRRRKLKHKHDELQRKKEELRELQREFMAFADQSVIIDDSRPLHEQAENLAYDRRYEIPSSMLPMTDGVLLGSGHYGEVVKTFLNVVEPPDRHEVAVKIVKNTLPNEAIHLHHLEIKIMIHIGNHVNILPLIGAVTETIPDNNMYLVTEYCQQGSLWKLLKDRRDVFIDEFNLHENITQDRENDSKEYEKPKKRFLASTHRFHRENMFRSTNELCTSDLLCYAFQIANGMEYLSSKHVIHRDLSARNVLVTKNNVIKISDFGLSRFGEIYQIKNPTDIKVPWQWLSLEYHIDHIFSEKSDVWSFGIVLWEIANLGRIPFPEFSHYTESFIYYLINGLRPNIPFEFESEPLYRLMIKCWSADPNLRPSYAQCKELIVAQLNGLCQDCYNQLDEVLGDPENVVDYSNLRSKFTELDHLSSSQSNPSSTSVNVENTLQIARFKRKPINENKNGAGENVVEMTFEKLLKDNSDE